MLLYRGVNEELFRKLDGKLKPKCLYEDFSSYAQYGQSHATCGSGIVYGESTQNTVVKHQWNQEGLPTSGISFSPLYERAVFYATDGNKHRSGYIFTIDATSLGQLGVNVYRVNDMVPFPAVPEDDEHILVAGDFGCIPEQAITKVEKL